MSDADALLSLLDASLRNSIIKFSDGNPKALCQGDALAMPPPFPRNIAVELKVDAFIPSEWFSFAWLSSKREPQKLHLGQPSFWQRLLGLARKYRLVMQVQIEAGVITNRVFAETENEASLEWLKTGSAQEIVN